MSVLKRYIVLGFTFVFLFLSTGFSFYQSFCNQGCDTKVAVFGGITECCDDESEQADSCHEEQEHTSSEDDCCGVEQISMELDFDMENTKVLAFNFNKAVVSIRQTYVYQQNLTETSLLNLDTPRGPPLPVKAGRVLLLEKNAFLI